MTSLHINPTSSRSLSCSRELPITHTSYNPQLTHSKPTITILPRVLTFNVQLPPLPPLNTPRIQTMGALPSSNRISAHDRAVLNLKVQRDKLKIYQKKISVILEAEHSAAKALLAKGDKPRALLALRRRKYQSTLLSQTDKQLETLEALTSSIEFALIEKDVLYGLKQGNEVLKQIHKEMTVESVERLMEDTAEGIRYQKEISDMLAGVMTNADEDEVEEELAAMEREVNGVPPEVVLPAIPSAPQTALGPSEEGEKALRAKERARARKAALERAVEEEPQPIAA